MPPSRPPKPEVKAARPERKPSEWSPRPVPTPGVGRSTEDPRTPTLRELAARGTQLASLTAGAPAAGATAAVAAASRAPLDCRQAWGEVMARTNAVLNAGDERESRPQQFLDRNRAISAAYAELAQGDPRMRWAGIASVVSTQAQCAMEHANTAVNRSAGLRRAASVLPNDLPGQAAKATTAHVYGSAVEVQRALYDTNREIFTDIYPAVAMYKRHGMDGVGSGPGQCGGSRPGRRMPQPIQRALARIDGGDIEGGSRILADYEQTRIVQERIYEDPNRPLLRSAMQLNQIVSDIPGVREAANLALKAQRPEVPISTDCGGGTPVPFRGDITVAQDRVDYYDDLVREYMRRDQGARDAMGRVIQGRDPLRGGPDYGPPRTLPIPSWPPRFGL